MIIKGITDTVIKPLEYVVWDKTRARYRAFDGFKDSPHDIVGMFVPDTSRSSQNAIPNQEIYIDIEPHYNIKQ